MTMRTLYNLMWLSLVFLISFLLAYQGPGNAQGQGPGVAPLGETTDCKIVTLHGKNMITVDPETVTVPKGACVIWFSRAEPNTLRITFREGKKCQESSEAPSSFILDQAGCYTTSYNMKEGTTASLRFMEPGTYDYEIEDRTRTITGKGQVVVQ